MSSSQQLLLSFTIVFSFCFDVPLTIWQSLCLYAMELILFLTAWVTWPFWFLLFAWDLHSTFVSLFDYKFFFLIFDTTILRLYRTSPTQYFYLPYNQMLYYLWQFLYHYCYTPKQNIILLDLSDLWVLLIFPKIPLLSWNLLLFFLAIFTESSQ